MNNIDLNNRIAVVTGASQGFGYAISKRLVKSGAKVINIDKTRINTFEFDQIDFNLQSFGSHSIIRPKIQEINSFQLLRCIFNKDINPPNECGQGDMISETKQELLKRFFKPIYILLITILSCFLLTKNFLKLSCITG